MVWLSPIICFYPNHLFWPQSLIEVYSVPWRPMDRVGVAVNRDVEVSAGVGNNEEEVRLQFSVWLADLVHIYKFIRGEILDQDVRASRIYFRSWRIKNLPPERKKSSDLESAVIPSWMLDAWIFIWASTAKNIYSPSNAHLVSMADTADVFTIHPWIVGNCSLLDYLVPLIQLTCTHNIPLNLGDCSLLN